MRKLIPRKPVLSEAKAENARNLDSQDAGNASSGPEQRDLQVDDSAKDEKPLRALLSRLSIEDSRDSENQFSNPEENFSTGTLRNVLGTQSSKQNRRTSLEKSLPAPSSAQTDHPQLENLPAHPGVRPSVQSRARSDHVSPRGVNSAADLDLNDSVDTTVNTKWATAVTHENITRNIHEVKEERVTREIHEHDVYHRILPIIDVEVLPARHYVEVNGRLQEVPKDNVPAGASKDIEQVLAQGLQKDLPKDTSPPGPRQFSARSFSGAEGDTIESTAPDGSVRTERYWVHPPTLEQGAMKSGQTRPLYLR